MIEKNGTQNLAVGIKHIGSYLSVFEVNFLYLATMGLVIILGSLVQAWSPFFGLILTEIFLIALPALLTLGLKKQLSASALHLTWPGAWVALAAVMIGLGLNLFNAWLTGVLLTLFGYSSAYGAALVPRDLPQAYLAFLGFAIFAPLCEEILFRGVILRGYDGLGFWRSIGIVAVLFAAYHLSFPRFIVILPVALALNWIASRTHSIGSSMLLHFGYNGVSALFLVLSVISPDYEPSWYGALQFAVVGLLLAAAALVLTNRLAGDRDKRAAAVAAPEPEPEMVSPTAETKPVTRQQAMQAVADVVESRAAKNRNRLFLWGRDWPLVAALVLFLGMGLADYIIGRSPDLLITQPLTLQPAGMNDPVAWKYELRNPADQVIGSATCKRTSEADRIRLECSVHQQAYQVTIGQSYFQDTTYDRHMVADWEPATLNLTHLDARTIGDQVNNSISVDPGSGGELTLKVTWGGQTQIPLTLPAGSLYSDEWPWRLMSMPFSDGYGGKASLAYPYVFNVSLNRSVPTQVDLVAMVFSRENVTVPAGSYKTWKVVVDKSTAWYDTANPHTLVKYTDGMTTYLLEGSQ